MLTILICGTRNREPIEVLERILSVIPPGSFIISGAARGVDRTAAEMAKVKGFTVREFPADWEKNGRSAGPIRNQQMLDQKPDLVVAVHEDPFLGKGTRDMVTRASRANIPVAVFQCK